MKKCKKCGSQNADENNFCINCGTIFSVHNDKVSIGFCILAYICPLFGLIYYIKKSNQRPVCSKAVGITAIASVLVNNVVVFLLLLLLPSLAGTEFMDNVSRFLSQLG